MDELTYPYVGRVGGGIVLVELEPELSVCVSPGMTTVVNGPEDEEGYESTITARSPGEMTDDELLELSKKAAEAAKKS